MNNFIIAPLLSLLTLSACNLENQPASTTPTAPAVDTTSPSVGDSTLTLSSPGSGQITVGWNAATDDTTAQAEIVYKVVYSTSDNLTTLSDAETNGTQAIDFTANTTSTTVTTGGGTYYFNVIAKDSAGNKTLYTSDFFSVGGCFLPETMILMADGTSKRIDQISVGDLVLSYDESGLVTTSKVGRIYIHQVDEYLDLITESARVGVTANHPFYSGSSFRAIGEMPVGSRIFMYSGDKRVHSNAIVSVTRVRADVAVYNLHISEGPPTYFANGLAVHNK